MNNRNRVSSRKRKRRRPRHILRPPDGVREYYSDASMAAVFTGLLPMTVIRIIMTVTELKADFDIFSILSASGVCALLLGCFLSFIIARINRHYTLAAAWTGMLAAVGFGLLFASDIRLLLNEPDILGAFQIISMLVYMACECIVIVSLLISAFGKRMSPSAGIPAAVSFAAAGLTYVFRAATSFSALLTALGKNYNWSNTSDLISAKRWILRSVEQSSAEAHTMVTVSLLYSLSVILAMLFSISVVFGFKSRFEDFNRRLFASADTEKYARYSDDEYDDDDENDENDDPYGLDYYDGIETLERDRYEIQKHAQLKEFRQEGERVRRRAARRAAQMDDLPFDESIYDDIERDERQPYREYNDGSERTDSRGPASAGRADQSSPRTPSGAIRVKVNTVKKEEELPAIPDPDDESIWNQYLE